MISLLPIEGRTVSVPVGVTGSGVGSSRSSVTSRALVGSVAAVVAVLPGPEAPSSPDEVVGVALSMVGTAEGSVVVTGSVTGVWLWPNIWSRST